jgi:hypothetical protein
MSCPKINSLINLYFYLAKTWNRTTNISFSLPVCSVLSHVILSVLLSFFLLTVLFCSVCLSVFQVLFPSTCQSICLGFHLSSCLYFLCLSIYPSISSFRNALSFCLPVYVSVHVCVCLFLPLFWTIQTSASVRIQHALGVSTNSVHKLLCFVYFYFFAERK